MHPTNSINFDRMLKQLYEFCEINSGSTHLSGLAFMQEKLKTAYAPLADVIETIDLPDSYTISMTGEKIPLKSGKALFIQKRPH